MFLIINNNNEILGFTKIQTPGAVEVNQTEYETILSKMNNDQMQAYYLGGQVSYQCREQTVIKPTYEELVESKIRDKYSVSDEIAILRQKETKPAEYQEYYLFCEQCKSFAKMKS